jgi:hypothetical protein
MFRTVRAAVIGAAAITVGVAGLALVATTAHADVARHQIRTLTYSSVNYYLGSDTTNAYPQSGTITANPCDGTFGGPGVVPGYGASVTSGHFTDQTHAVYTVSYTVGTQTDYLVTASVTVNSDFSFSGTWSDNYIGGPQSGTVSSSAPSPVTSTSYASHGAYVKANGGGDDAAHSCLGMPVQSRK